MPAHAPYRSPLVEIAAWAGSAVVAAVFAVGRLLHPAGRRAVRAGRWVHELCADVYFTDLTAAPPHLHRVDGPRPRWDLVVLSALLLAWAAIALVFA